MGHPATQAGTIHPPNATNVLSPGTGLGLQEPSLHAISFFAVFDWVRLGLFTGSRGNEYCQTMARRHEVTRVPLDAVAGEHAGEPIAFIMTDFRFLTVDDTILSPESSIRQPNQVVELQIRFRFDKSPINGRWRKFRRTSHGYLCPVLAGLSIVQRAIQLQVPRLTHSASMAGHTKSVPTRSYAPPKSSALCVSW